MSDDRVFTRGDVEVTFPKPFVALCEIRRPPNNFFDADLILALADLYEELGADAQCRAIVLASEGQHFCAGADFSNPTNNDMTPETGNLLYANAFRLFKSRKPVIAAIQGGAIGGGFGLAMSADFRVGCPDSRLSANFAKLGFTPGFGLTHTLPRAVGVQTAAEIFLSGRRLKGDEAKTIGILDRLVDSALVRDAAIAFAELFAESAPLAVEAILQSMRGKLGEEVKSATDSEFVDQYRLMQTDDFKEGLRAVAERRPGNFLGK